MSLEETLCPECNSKMISRSGKYGVFWGCSKFPECKGTRDSQGRSKADREEWKRKNKPEYDGSDIVEQENRENKEHFSFNKK